MLSPHRVCIVVAALLFVCEPSAATDLAEAFTAPPPAARPWTYWFIMDGHLTREGITADLESMRSAGLGGVIIMEVDVGIPRGPVEFMSPPWCELLRHAVEEAERLGLEITLNAGPGWTGSGGPWVPAEQSMQHLVAAEVPVTGPQRLDMVLPRPAPRQPYFGAKGLPAEMLAARENFYADVAVLAVPQTDPAVRINDLDEKALYVRDPYSSMPGVKPFLLPPASESDAPAAGIIPAQAVIDLTSQLRPDGQLLWDVPPGEWVILRFGRRTTGANTRPAPRPGLGWECDKFDRAALDLHFDAFVVKLLTTIGPRPRERRAGWTMLHIDSWEMGAQNWSAQFATEFTRRRGYSPLPYLPVMTGRIVGSRNIAERFLWDLRRTAQELVVENHAQHLKSLGQEHGLGLSIEPYDMNPSGDMTLGAVADVPMCEFWSQGYGFSTEFSCIQAASIAHTNGRPIVAAEAFTADAPEAWRLFPGAMKNQGDWALGTGINRIVFHRFAHQPWLDRRPGMTMGPYGVHWDRTQTWWSMVSAYHQYLARCQVMLRAGAPVADVCYLAPEGAPHVFRAPDSALEGPLGDRRGYNFDGCDPLTLMAHAAVEGDRLVFPGGAAYRLLVLPAWETMTPPLLRKVVELAEAGATVVGNPPCRSPSLSGFPQCDAEVQALVTRGWGSRSPPPAVTRRPVGLGAVVWGGPLDPTPPAPLATDPLSGARWIWYPEGNPAASAPAATRHFRHTFALPPGRTPVAARVEMTADNAFRLWVNGQLALQGNNFHDVFRADITPLLRDGDNVLAVEADNHDTHDNPAGLIGAVEVSFADDTRLHIVTDEHWRVARTVSEPDWQTRVPDPAGWTAARDLGALEMPPWQLTIRRPALPELYPAYERTADILAGVHVPPDFEADAPLRYTHRRTPDADIYFVASRSDAPVAARCTFRVAGRQPELWDPLSGHRRALPEYHTLGGRTELPLFFAPYQSFFVVFRAPNVPGAAQADSGRNFDLIRPVATITGPWQVSFETATGGPTGGTWPALIDWRDHPDAAVRHFAGVATYRCDFPRPSGTGKPSTRWLLDLGTVHSMAQVRVNGRDLGMVWCAPWHVDVTDVLREEDNKLEIRVANLWPNRLIADAGLPMEQRQSWTTWNPYRPTDPLLPSGLLGPVTLQRVP